MKLPYMTFRRMVLDLDPRCSVTDLVALWDQYVQGLPLEVVVKRLMTDVESWNDIANGRETE